MRRYARTLIFIAVLVTLSVIFLSIKEIDVGNFERGGDTILGLSLGLDLQGGSHLVYRALDTDTGEPFVPEQDQMEALKRAIEKRVNASGLGEPIIQLLGSDRLLIQLPGVDDPDRAKDLIGETAQLVFKHRRLDVVRALDEIAESDIVGITVGTLPQEGPELQEPSAEAEAEVSAESAAVQEEGLVEEEQAVEAATSEPPEVEETAEATQEGEPAEETVAEGEEPAEGESEEPAVGPPVLIVEFTAEGADKFAVVLERLELSLLQFTTRPNTLEISVEGIDSLRFELTSLSIRRIDDSTQFAFQLPTGIGVGESTEVDEVQALLGDDPAIQFTENQGKVDEDIGLTGDDLARAYPDTHNISGDPIVVLEFKDRGIRIWGELTSQIAGSQRDAVAIFLDDEELIAPVVRSAITAGSTIIQGSFTLDRVKDLALLLEAGSLPVTIELIQERDVDAILGADSLRKSVIAGVVGLSLVLMFMTLYYRLPGLVASVSLLIYAALLLAIFKLLPITLTLSGVAAVILSIGMAVDANILIFERMKEELRAGRTLLSAINIGFNRAWPAIRDGNVSTIITCLVLFYFSSRLGTTVVQGFAVALGVGVLLSMFTAIVVSRTFLRVMAATAVSRKLELFVPSGGAQLPQLQPAAAGARRS